MKMNHEKDRLISKQVAAETMGVSVRTVEREISAGRLVTKRVRGCVRLSLFDVLRHAGLEPSLLQPS